MRRTISRHYRLPAPAGERRVNCDYCGMKWYRSELVRDPSGYLACPDDQDGRDISTLDRLNSQYAARAAQARHPLRRLD